MCVFSHGCSLSSALPLALPVMNYVSYVPGLLKRRNKCKRTGSMDDDDDDDEQSEPEEQREGCGRTTLILEYFGNAGIVLCRVKDE